MKGQLIVLSGEHTWQSRSGDDCFVWFYDLQCYREQTLSLPMDRKYHIYIIDTWEMTRTTATTDASDETMVKLPAKEGIAVIALSCGNVNN